MRKFNTFVALFRADGTEPSACCGYKRAEAGAVDAWHLTEAINNRTIVFPEIKEPGCGIIAGYALYNAAEGGDPLYIWWLDAPVNAHAGTVPFIHNGKLLLGVDVSANISLVSANENAM